MPSEKEQVTADERGLPSLDELTPLTQTLISPELASAFSIADESSKTPADVLSASKASMSSVQRHSSSSHFNSFLPFVAKEQDKSNAVGFERARAMVVETETAKSDLGHGGISFGPFASNTAGFNPGATMQQGAMELSRKVETVMLPSIMNTLPYSAYERRTESSYVGGAGASDSSNGGGSQPKRARTQQAADGADSEEGDSGGGPENSGEDQAARTLKRPRLVWTPQLHKRFVDAVAHLGIKNAVPKTIMQLMNVEGLTRENVASHLQKYRLYLKRMQGLTSEGPTASDQLFASTPIPPGLAASANFLPSHRDDVVAIPFAPPMLPVAMPGLNPASMGAALAYGAFDQHPYAAVMRANAQRFAAGEHRELGMDNQAPSNSSQRPILTLFPTSSH
ncbi:hypothetical protein O6H91_13G029500 [Diphasiastrum complanatum]|uniref:Uncharacterized protein n=2 Tax=Diphasiastrum complanatum TaxID=34168 RepID=A0ACC2BTC0_DIPCM|nr:hypothetical protein O6H91_21G045200 [Diphasiastrum complanatum]KAJ7533013.1 hypothetical protein O6H91_13G029500 [Diphasiastrum complanatum]